jgi:hypothetical protein
MGNWLDISEQYVKTKEPKECEEHYFSFYYRSREESIPKNEDFIVKG